MKWLMSVLALCASAACSDPAVLGVREFSSVHPFEVVIAQGQEILVDGVFGVQFTDVSGDSRCATDVVCVWQGNAGIVIGLTVGDGPTHPFTLNTGIEPHFAVHGGYRVRLLEVRPEPVSTSPIQLRDYRVKLRIEAVS